MRPLIQPTLYLVVVLAVVFNANARILMGDAPIVAAPSGSRVGRAGVAIASTTEALDVSHSRPDCSLVGRWRAPGSIAAGAAGSAAAGASSAVDAVRRNASTGDVYIRAMDATLFPPVAPPRRRQQSAADDAYRAYYHAKLNPLTPILDDEINALHLPAWRRPGALRAPSAPALRAYLKPRVAAAMGLCSAIPGVSARFVDDAVRAAAALYQAFSIYDRAWAGVGARTTTGGGDSQMPDGIPAAAAASGAWDSSAEAEVRRNATTPVYATACVGSDCHYIYEQLIHLDTTGVGHVLVMHGGERSDTALMFDTMQKLFPGRFTVFLRPRKLGCSEAWNLLFRVGFSRGMWTPTAAGRSTSSDREAAGAPAREAAVHALGEGPEYAGLAPPAFVFIANADWHTRNGLLEAYNRFAHTQLDKPIVLLTPGFSAYGLTWKGYTRVGSFDESIFPAYAEDLEWHMRATARGMATLGRYGGEDRGAHVGSASIRDGFVGARNPDSARQAYLRAKWGEYDSSKLIEDMHGFQHPFNMGALARLDALHGSWAVDVEYRRCQNRPQWMGPCAYNPDTMKRLLEPST